MQRRYIASLLLIVSAGAYLLASDHSNGEVAAHHDVESRGAGAQAHVAMNDMLEYAAVHLTMAVPHPNSFGSAPGWMPGWGLHWMDFHSDGHLVRVYQATHEHHPHIRFVAIVHPDHHHHSGGWHLVH